MDTNPTNITTQFLRVIQRLKATITTVFLSFAVPLSAPADPTTWRETFAAQYFSPASSFNDFADPDGDGLVNLVEYAFALSPVAWNPPGSGVTVSTAYEGTKKVLTMTFRRDPRATDLSYDLETSSDLTTWNTVAESNAGATPYGSAFISEADAPGEAPVKIVTAKEWLPVGTKRFVRVRITTPPSPPPTLIFEQVGGITSGFTVPGVPLDLSANRYIIEFSGATWTGAALANYGNVQFTSSSGASKFWMRSEGGYMTLFESDNNNDTNWSSTGQGSTSLFAPVADTPYKLGIECGCGQAHVIKDGVALTRKATQSSNSINRYQRMAVASARPEPANLVKVALSSGVTASALRIYRREWATINQLVLLGDSITSMNSAQEWDYRLRQDLGQSWLIHNQGVGYRQSREMKAAVLTPFAGDPFNVGNYYPDVAGLYRNGAASNWVLIGIGTNDIVNFNLPVQSQGPQSGGYTATATIDNILGAIADIRANNPGWKVAVRTVLNCNGVAAGGAYTTAESMRQTINASIMSGSIAAAADRVINQDNVFAPAASRTDGVNADGPLYDAGYWPVYSNNPATFDNFHVHPTATAYRALADYVAARFH